MKKQIYEQPQAETFEVQLSANVLQDASPYGGQGAAGQNITSGGVYTFDDDGE